MLRLHARHDRRFAQTDGYDAYYAGAEANACVLLSRLGIGVDYVTVLPDNEIARTGGRQLQAQGERTISCIAEKSWVFILQSRATTFARPVSSMTGMVLRMPTPGQAPSTG